MGRFLNLLWANSGGKVYSNMNFVVSLLVIDFSQIWWLLKEPFVVKSSLRTFNIWLLLHAFQ